MSFLHELYDEAVYQEILNKMLKKTAQEAPPDLPPFKDAPVAPGQKPLSQNDIAKKLVHKLSREMSGAGESLNISSESPAPVDLGVNQLQNLGKLLQFMDANRIKLDGSRIVFSEAESKALPEGERNQLAPISVNVSRDAETRKWQTADFYTHLPLLIKYVSYLQDKAKKLKDNGDVQGRILEVMIGKLIDSINAIKPDSGLSRKPKATPDKPNELPDNTELDTFETKVFNIQDPYSDKGRIPLTAKDLASKESLNAWMRQAPEAQIISGLPPPAQVISGQSTPVKYTAPNANHCIVINTLYKRALNASRTASSAEETKKYNFYLKKISEIGPLFTDAQGRACSVGSSGSEVSGRQNFFGPEQTDAGGTLNANEIKATVEKIAQSLPLDPQDIDFNRINNFFTLYQNIASTNSKQAAIASIAVAKQAMASAFRLTNNKNTFRITRNVQEFVTWLKPPAGDHGLEFLYDLQQVISETGNVLGMFYNEFAKTQYSGSRVTLNNEEKTLVEAQYLGGNSIYSQNLRDIQSLMANFQNAVGKK